MNQILTHQRYSYQARPQLSHFLEQKKRDNKKVLNNLKQQMTSIRESMNQLIKVKSQENFKNYSTGMNRSSCLPDQARAGNQGEIDAGKCESGVVEGGFQGLGEVRGRLQVLERENLKLTIKNRELEGLLLVERKQYSRKIVELELAGHKQQQKLKMLNKTIQSLNSSIQTLNSTITTLKTQKSPLRPTEAPNPEQQLQATHKIDYLPNKLLEQSTSKQVGRLKKLLRQIQKQKFELQKVNNSKDCLIAELNQKIIKLTILGLPINKGGKYFKYEY